MVHIFNFSPPKRKLQIPTRPNHYFFFRYQQDRYALLYVLYDMDFAEIHVESHLNTYSV